MRLAEKFYPQILNFTVPCDDIWSTAMPLQAAALREVLSEWQARDSTYDEEERFRKFYPGEWVLEI